MTAPSLLDELEGVVRLMDAASFVDLDWGWRRDDDDTPGSIFTHSFGGMHQAVAMCPRYGKDSFAADASYIVALHNFLRIHHAEIANMAKRLEVAERDARVTKRSSETLCRIYFEIAAEAVGEDKVRAERDRRIHATQEGEE